MPQRVLTGVLALLALAAPARALESVQEQSRKSFAAAGLKGVQIDNSRGRIELLPAGGDSIEVVAVKSARGRNATDARTLAAGTSVEISRERGYLWVRVRYPQVVSTVSWFNFDWGEGTRRGVHMKIFVRLPAKLEAGARSASGDIHSSGIPGPQTLISTSGDVRVESAGGKVDAHATSGDIIVRDLGADAALHTVSGDVRATALGGGAVIGTTSGDVRLTGAGGPAHISTVSGDVVVRDAPAGLVVGTTSGDVVARGVGKYGRVNTSSGDVDAQLFGPLQGAELSTASGDVVLRLSPGVSCTLEARTGSGEISVQSAFQVQTVSRHLVAGAIGAGGAPVKLRTSAGEIRVIREGATQ